MRQPIYSVHKLSSFGLKFGLDISRPDRPHRMLLYYRLVRCLRPQCHPAILRLTLGSAISCRLHLGNVQASHGSYGNPPRHIR